MSRLFSLCLVVVWLLGASRALRAEPPRVQDPRLQVELFASAPDIVHPVGIDFDARGRLLVIESHTHFPPQDYKGPKHDRIRVLEDTDGDGKADRFTTFFEGTRATMDIAVHPDGAVYLATRNEILRLRDTDGDGKADVQERLVFLDTKGNYPHNGLSGLCFDSRGDLYFGMGENLGAAYKLIGADGVSLSGEGEGGNVFWCSAQGKKLRRVATGFWNPFGICRDRFGRLFAVDNDPDAMPPCRMMHVVEGGDFGYQFRYGRAGRHPFQAWNGQLTGTLPMMAGTGEAPCEILSYESDGLPREYLGDLLVTSWADHRVERYAVQPRGSSFVAERKPFVQGGADFRPVGLAVAPVGSLFVSDWVLSNYTLHGKGAIWHIRPKQRARVARQGEARQALLSLHRPLRDSAARQLASDERGRGFLREQLSSSESRVRASALTALIDASDDKTDLQKIAERDTEPGLRALAVRALAGRAQTQRGKEVGSFLDPSQPAELRREAVLGLRAQQDLPRLLELLADADPFLRHAAVQQLAGKPDLLGALEVSKVKDPRRRAGLLLAQRAAGSARGLSSFLNDPDEEVRFLAIKWIADEKLRDHRPRLVELLKERDLNSRLFVACSTALARIEGQEVNEGRLADHFLSRVTDEQTAPGLRVLALQAVPANHPRLTLDLLSKLLAGPDAGLQREAVRALCEHPSSRREPLLLEAVSNSKLPEVVRAQAVSGLSERAADRVEDLIRLARGDRAILREEALRALLTVPLPEARKTELTELARREPASADGVARLLGQPFWKDRPPTKEVASWLKRLEGPADPEAGRRVFFHPKLGGCYRCHRVDGRGQEVGPDLSFAGRTERRHLLESILQPSALVAPHYQAWQIETSDGKIQTGLLARTYLDEYSYLDAKGNLFKLNTRNIVEMKPAPNSLMPDGLVNLLTDQELRDLLAYLGSRR